jgi:IPT/TIG domain/Fibronectin type III domain/Calcineurin-like phosphoesterase
VQKVGKETVRRRNWPRAKVHRWGIFPQTSRMLAAIVGVTIALLAPASSGAGTSAAATITSVSPTSGAVGSAVTITGTNFVNVSQVTFYDSPSPSWTVNSNTSITAVVPAGTPSPGRWRVVTPDGTAVYDAAFTVTGTPTITSVSPTSGAVGSAVTITGSNLANVTKVTFYDSPSPSWTLNSPTSITAVVPAGTPSPGRWRVVNPAYTAVYDPTFTVTGTPTITNVSPTSGAVGSAVTITGANFANVTKVTFYDSPSPSWTLNSPTSITAVVPAGTPSPGRWRVVNPAYTAVYNSLFSVTASDTTAPTTPTGLSVTGATQTSISLSWNASNDNVGVTGYNVYRDGTLAATANITSLTADSLTCGKTYGFTVQAKDAAGNVSGQSPSVGASTAACTSGGDPVITAAGDICNSSLNCSATATLVEQINPTRALTLGDNAYNDGSLTQYNTYYNPNWGRFRAKTSPSTGNHEYHTSGAADYFTYFGSTLAPGPYYSYDIGAWHLISLASSSGVSPSGGGAEETWLKQDLAAHTNKCVLAYWHEPRWSSGTTHGSNSSWSAIWTDLYAAHADVVLNGHEHNYERFAKQNPSGAADAAGIREFVVGTGGASHGYPFGTPLANSQVRNDSTWGVLKLTLHATGYDWQFVPVAGSTFTDSGSDSCS